MSHCQITLSVSDLTDRHLGAPYVRHGRDPRTGIDCLGWVLLVAREVYGLEIADPIPEVEGVSMLRRIDAFKKQFRRVEFKDLEPGCVAYDPKRRGAVSFQHIAIYEGAGWWSHTSFNDGVCRIRMSEWNPEHGCEFYALGDPVH